jgi:hypothetical protein
MSTGIPYGGAAQRWHDNPLQEEVDRLRAFKADYECLEEAQGSYLRVDWQKFCVALWGIWEARVDEMIGPDMEEDCLWPMYYQVGDYAKAKQQVEED